MSTLKSLSNCKPGEAAIVLSHISSALMPNPYEQVSPEGPMPDLHEEVMGEIRRQLRIKKEDRSPASLAKIYSFLSQSISEAVLSGVDIKVVKGRLAEKGILRPDLYQIDFPYSFIQSEHLGVRKSHALDSILKPDDVKEILPRNSYDNTTLSLYLKRHLDKAKDPFAMLSLVKDIGDIRRIFITLRIYYNDLNASPSMPPFELLEAFLDVYGEYLMIGPLTSKIFLKEPIRYEINAARQDVEMQIRLQAETRHKLFGGIFFARSTALSDTIEISFSFIYDQSRYARDLMRHGIHITLPDLDDPSTRLHFESSVSFPGLVSQD